MIEKDGLKYYGKDDVFSKEEYYQLLQQYGYEKTYGSFLVSFQDMINSGMVVRSGRNIYRTAAFLQPYEYSFSQFGQQVNECMTANHHYLNYIIFETAQLNEFLPKEIERNTVFVYVDSMMVDFVFDTLSSAFDGRVMLSPKADEFRRYGRNNTIVVGRLVSEAPKDEKNPNRESIEKMLVDIMAESIVRETLSDIELKSIYESAFDQYIIDESRMFRYGRRRNADRKIKDFIIGNTSILLNENR